MVSLPGILGAFQLAMGVMDAIGFKAHWQQQKGWFIGFGGRKQQRKPMVQWWG